MNGISRETFDTLDDAGKFGVIFDYLKLNHECACDTKTKLETLERRFERKKRVDSAVAAGGGLVGGFIAWISSTFINK